MSDSDITSQETDKCREEYDCGNDVDCFTQPTEPNDCVLLNLAAKKRVKYFVGLMVITPLYSHLGYFVSQKLKTLQ